MILRVQGTKDPTPVKYAALSFAKNLTGQGIQVKYYIFSIIFRIYNPNEGRTDEVVLGLSSNDFVSVFVKSV